MLCRFKGLYAHSLYARAKKLSKDFLAFFVLKKFQMNMILQNGQVKEIFMKYNIIYKEELDKTLLFVLNKLPLRLKNEISDFLEHHRFKSINEIRIHRNSNIMLIADSLNILTDIYVSEDIIDSCIDSLCSGSIYAHFRTIKDGYISVGKGVRAGICGKACLENGEICGVSDITSINIRIPQHIQNASSYLYNILKDNGFFSSVIIYSAPGVGKTTILRDLIYKLSYAYPPIRYAVIDSRDEITASIEEKINADIFISYPKGTAIELATKSMTPQLIVCDEISSIEEANDVLNSVNSGVKLIATAHASSFEELMEKGILQGLFDNGVFDYALGVSREYGEKRYKFKLTKLKWSY